MTSRALLWTAVLGALQLFGPKVSDGAITETTPSNRPPFSFACGQDSKGSIPTFCSLAPNDKKYLQVQSVEIYRDYINVVGRCLEPEKFYIAQMLTDWFNYDCKIPKIDRDEETKKMPIDLVKEAMTKHCGIANADVMRIVVNYECVKVRPPGAPRNDTPSSPTRHPGTTGEVVSATEPTATSSTLRASTSITSAWRTSSIGQPQKVTTRPSSGSSGGVIETSASNRPPFSFGCSPKLGGLASTFCGVAENNTYMSIDLVEIYRDYTNQVGNCLDPEKAYIAQILHEWFNYDCKIPVAPRVEEFKSLPVHMLKVAMTAHCGKALADVSRIVVHYQCVKALPHFKSGTSGMHSNGSLKSAN